MADQPGMHDIEQHGDHHEQPAGEQPDGSQASRRRPNASTAPAVPLTEAEAVQNSGRAAEHGGRAVEPPRDRELAAGFSDEHSSPSRRMAHELVAGGDSHVLGAQAGRKIAVPRQVEDGVVRRANSVAIGRDDGVDPATDPAVHVRGARQPADRPRNHQQESEQQTQMDRQQTDRGEQ